MTRWHTILQRSAAAAAILLSAPMAEAAAKPGDFDLDNDGTLTPSEQSAFETYVTTLEGAARPEAGFYRDVLDELRDQGYPIGTPIPVGRILTYIPPDECEWRSGFVLRRDVTEGLLTDCTPLGAVISFSSDSEADTTTLAINGGIAYRSSHPGKVPTTRASACPGMHSRFSFRPMAPKSPASPTKGRSAPACAGT